MGAHRSPQACPSAHSPRSPQGEAQWREPACSEDRNGGPGLLQALCALPAGSQEGGCLLAWPYPASLVVTQPPHTRLCTQPWGIPGLDELGAASKGQTFLRKWAHFC